MTALGCPLMGQSLRRDWAQPPYRRSRCSGMHLSTSSIPSRELLCPSRISKLYNVPALLPYFARYSSPNTIAYCEHYGRNGSKADVDEGLLLSARGGRFLAAIIVEAAAGFAPQPARFDIFHQQRT